MKRFSLQRMGNSAERAIRRFPLTLICAVAAGIVACFLAHDDDPSTLLNLLMACQLGIPLFITVTLVHEQRDHLKLPAVTGLVGRLLGVVLLALYFLSLPEDLGDFHIRIYIQLNIGLHLLVAVLPFARGGLANGMWQFNVTLLLRLLTGVFFASVLFGGLSVALLAVDTLFGVEVDDELYLQLWSLLVFVFITAYTLGGVAPRLTDLEAVREVPRIVRIFAQYILAPLVLVYLAILVAYLVKVVATAEWPSGWIGYLVSSVALVGLLSLLLLKPVSEREDNHWIHRYSRLFHILMIPAVIMLALAVSKRIGQYGVTEMRYFLAVLTVWLMVVVVVGSLRRALLFKAIPATLALLAFLTSVGPWAAGDVSQASQLHRLDTMLTEQDRFQDGVITSSDQEVPLEERRQISAVLVHLFSRYGDQVLGDRADDDLRGTLTAIADSMTSRYDHPQRLARATTQAMAMPFANRWDQDDVTRYEVRRSRSQDFQPTLGHEYFQTFSWYGDEQLVALAGADSCRVKMSWEPEPQIVIHGLDRFLELPLQPVLDALIRHLDGGGISEIPDSLLVVQGESSTLRAIVLIDHLSWSESGEGSRMLTGKVLLSYGVD